MNLLQMSLSGAIFVLIVVIIRALTINKLPKITFLVLWYIALFRLLLPVTFQFPFGIYSILDKGVSTLEPFGNGITNFATEVLPNQPGVIENETMQAVHDSTQSIPVLISIWAVGMAITAGFSIMSYFRCRREFQTALPVQNDFMSLWRRKHPLWRTIGIRQLTGLSTPLTYGIFRPVILMPKDTEWENERQAEYVLFHEYVHIRRFDAVGKLIASAALCIHWFNPLVWVLYLLFNRDMELSCDECVIWHFGEKERKGYAMALIYMEERKGNLSPFGNYFSKNATEERIKAIMKFKEKTVFVLAFAVIVVIIGAVGAFTMAPKTGNADFEEILCGNAQFLYVLEGVAEPKNIEDIPALFDPNDVYMKIWDFSVLDLDGDGNTEVILSVFGVAGDMGGHLILHQMNGKVYGYIANSRTLVDLKADGTYSYSDSTGMVESGICSITDFTERGYICDKITYGHGGYGGWDTFVVNHQSATEEEFWDAENMQAQKPDATWYDFTAENIELVF